MIMYYDPTDPTRGAVAVPQGTMTQPIDEAQWRSLLPPATPPIDWNKLYQSLIDPDKGLALFLWVKAKSKLDLGVNTSFTVLMTTITTTKAVPALYVAINELKADIEALELTEAEQTEWSVHKSTWNLLVTESHLDSTVHI
jgi:hypothetical protein